MRLFCVQFSPTYISCWSQLFCELSGVTTMGSDRANPGAPNPNRPNGGPKAQAIEQKHRPAREASDMLQCRFLTIRIF